MDIVRVIIKLVAFAYCGVQFGVYFNSGMKPNNKYRVGTYVFAIAMVLLTMIAILI